MRYEVSDKFFNTLLALYTTAVEDENEVELELAMSILMDTAKGQDLV